MNYFDLDLIETMRGKNKIKIESSAMKSDQQRHYRILTSQPNYVRLHELVQQRYELVKNYSERLIPDDQFTQMLDMLEQEIKKALILE